MLRITCLGAVVFMMATMTVKADQVREISEADYARVNAYLIDSHVIPRYEVLVQNASGFLTTARSFCNESEGAELSVLRDDFHKVMDAWFGIAHIQFGPIEFLMRQFRFYFWPQARGKVVDSLAEMAVSGATGELTDSNVAVQGLLAAEALLFNERFFGGGSENQSQNCSLLVAVAHNMENMAIGTLEDWRDRNTAYAQFMKQPDADNPFYENHATATLSFFQSLYNSLQFAYDINLKPVVGESIVNARPVLAESRPSARSMRNIVVTLNALEELYGVDGNVGLGRLAARTDADLDALMQKAFRITLANARSLNVPIEVAAIDEEKRPQLEKLAKQVLAMKQIVRSRLAKAIGMTVGFNALDGD
ncbi:MAG: imelysin family protein [Gammaproteobacteria bacterium]|nr:imelysin family protein [Gammaproteobacteria bacterium]